VEGAIVLDPNGNIKKGMQANVEIGETSTTANTTNVSRIEVEL
jgi:hypothetical protein